MDVLRTNFKDTLPILKQAIAESTFFAIDTELTGLKTGTGHAFNTMEERYRMVYEKSRKFLINQFGLSCFRYHPDEKKYTHKDFNFYVFQHKYLNHISENDFACEPASLVFLSSYGFDFNKWIGSGVNYLTPSQEQKIRQDLIDSHNLKFEALSQKVKEQKEPQETLVDVPDEHREFIDHVQNQVNAFVSDDEQQQLDLPICNGYRRKLIYECVLPKHPNGIVMSTEKNTNGDCYISVTKLTDAAMLDQMQKKHLSDLEEVQDAVGLRKVLDMISESKKLVVGHNMLLDLTHTINQFYHPLPSTLQEFKDIVRNVFPHIIDTKTLAKLFAKNLFSSTALFSLWDDIKAKSLPIPKYEAAEGFDCYSEGHSKEHVAGYDAFITGMCFISICAKLAQDHHHEYVSPESKFLNPYANRPYVMRHFDTVSLNLRGPDPEPTRENVFFVTFPKQWRKIDLVELFTPYGEIYVSWVNDVSAFVALKSPNQAVNVKRNLLKQTSSLYKVCSYVDYMQTKLFKVPSGSNSVSNPGQDNHKRKRSSSDNSSDGPAAHRIIMPIPEEDECVTPEKQDNCVTTSLESSPSATLIQTENAKSKKKKKTHEEPGNSEVSSTEKLFEEPSIW